MKKAKSSLSSMLVALITTAIVSGLALSTLHSVTVDPIEEQARKTLSDGIKVVMGREDITIASNDTVVKDFSGKSFVFILHKANDKEGVPLGVAVESTVSGFGGDLKVLVGFDNQNTILGYTILQHSETPGLGAKADTWFQKDGKGCIIGRKVNAQSPLTVSKDGGDVDAITASTITSRAFLKAINQAFSVFSGQDTDGDTGASMLSSLRIVTQEVEL